MLTRTPLLLVILAASCAQQQPSASAPPGTSSFIYYKYPMPEAVSRLDYAPGYLSVQPSAIDKRPVFEARGANRVEGPLTYLETNRGRWAVLLSDDGVLLSLLQTGGEENYTARLDDNGQWIDALTKPNPTISNGINMDGTAAFNISVEPAGTPEPYDLLQTPSVSWVSAPEPAGTVIRFDLPHGTRKIYFANGYIDVANPEAYHRYARVKTLRLVSGANVHEIQLRDTPHYQAIQLPFDVPPGSKVQIDLVGFYPGQESAAALNEILCVALGKE